MQTLCDSFTRRMWGSDELLESNSLPSHPITAFTRAAWPPLSERNIGCLSFHLQPVRKEGAQTRLIPCHLRVLPPPSDESGYGLDWECR